MPHQDQSSEDRCCCFGVQLREAIQWLIQPEALSEIHFRRECSWTAWTLTAAAMLWAWSGEFSLIARFHSSRQVIQKSFGVQRELAGSYQAFLKMLVRWTASLLPRVVMALRNRMRRRSGRHRIAGWAIFGVDGSRVELPRTKLNQEQFCPLSARGKRRRKRRSQRKQADRKKADNPQMWITTMWQCGMNLPWDWRSGRADSSERAHLLEMIPALPDDALVTADAGFVGYDYWEALLNHGHPFVIRVGSNVKLLKNLGCAREHRGTVYLWPDALAKKEIPPLVLRLVALHTGREPVYLVTSITDTTALPDRTVGEIYQLRWGVEVFYRSFKQTFARRKLSSRKAEHAAVELAWSMVGLWAACLYAQHCGRIAPQQVSVACVLRAFRRTIRFATPPDPGVTLSSSLQEAVLDNYARKNKASRDYPRKKRQRPPGAPEIIRATRTQARHAGKIKAAQKG